MTQCLQPIAMPLDEENPRMDAAALQSLMAAHQAELLCYARSLVRDEEEARDIVQEAFLRLWKKPPRPESLRAWLYQVCRSQAMDYWRRQKRRGSPVETENDPAFCWERQPDPEPHPGEALAQKDAEGNLLDQLAFLPERQQELLRLKFQAGLSYKEIAETTGLSVSNVGFLLHTAVAALRQRLHAIR